VEPQAPSELALVEGRPRLSVEAKFLGEFLAENLAP